MHRPSRCIALRPVQATQLRRRLRRLPLKKVPWPQGARPLDGTCRVQRPCSKKRATKISLALRKVLACSLHWHIMVTLLFQRAKTPHCSWRQRAETSKIKPSVTKGPLWC